jgi:hypothetical protein
MTMVWVSFSFERGDQFILVSGELGGVVGAA